MTAEDIEEWRRVTLRHLEELGFLRGQVLDGLPAELDTRWFRKFVDGEVSGISPEQQKLLLQSFCAGTIKRRKRGLRCMSLDVSALTSGEERLRIYRLSIKPDD